MKHIKLFENFDPYDFGRTVFVNGDDSEYMHAYHASIPFDEDAKHLVYSELGNYVISEYPTKTPTSTMVIASAMIDHLSLTLYYHGDYCYSVSEIDEQNYEALVIHKLNTLDDAIELIKQIMIKWENIKMFEKFDQYDFGLREGDLSFEFSGLYDSSVLLENDDIKSLYELFGEKYLIKEYPKAAQTRSISFELKYNNAASVSMYYHGDYCYSLMVWNNLSNDIIAIHTVDTFESTVEIIREILEKWDKTHGGIVENCGDIRKTDMKLFENFDQYDFGVREGDLTHEYLSLYECIEDLDAADIQSIYELFEEKYVIKEYPNLSLTNSITIRLNHSYPLSVSMHYHGDYCYSLVVMDRKPADIIAIYTVDTFESTVEILIELLEKWDNGYIHKSNIKR